MFTVDAHPSLAYTFIKDHTDWNGKTLKPGQKHFPEEEPWSYLHSELNLKDTTYLFDWYLDQKNDSLTKISVGVSDKDRSLANRFAILFSRTNFENSIRKNMTIIRDQIIERNKEFRYQFHGLDSIAEVPCVFVSSRSSLRGKADEMIRNVIKLNMFVKEHDLGLNGNPMVVVKKWVPSTDSIDFDFCFPILHPELVPSHPEIKTKIVSVPRALRVDFYGNYSYSDYTWSRLFDEVKRSGYENSGRIVEIYYNDPHTGGNDLNWKAGIYMELKN